MTTHFTPYEPPKCWVGNQQKISYATEDEARAAALIAQHDYGSPPLSVYHCEYGDHWHLSSHQPNNHQKITKNHP